MSVLDHHLISERYFFPRGYAAPNPTWVDVDGARLACFSRRNGHPLTLVHFHGNGEVVGDYVPDFVELVDELGADCFLAEYRGYGGSSGRPQLRTMLDDIPAIFDAVGRPPSEIVVFGRSVGSIYAIEFASRYPVAGLILESGIADPGERVLMRATPDELGTTPQALAQEFVDHLDNASKLASRTRPTLVMHARMDSMVDFSHAVRLAAFPAKNVRLVLFPYGDHNTIFGINREQYIDEVREHLAVCRDGGSYATSSNPVAGAADETLDGGIAVFDRTDEFPFVAPDLTPGRRHGPGSTAQMQIPDVLRHRAGPGDTVETKIRTGEEE